MWHRFGKGAINKRETRDEGRLSVAKANGFDTVEDLEEALEAMKAGSPSAELNEVRERVAEETEKRGQLQAELQAATVEREAQLQVLELGGTPHAVADILTLRRKANDVLEDGEPNVDAIRSSIEAVFNAHPQLRGGQVRERSSSSAAMSTGGLVGIKARLKEKFQRR